MKSQEINERIGRLTFLPRSSPAHHLLTANEKTIKLWRVKERKCLLVTENNATVARKLQSTDIRLPLILPRLSIRESMVMAQARRVYSSIHAYHLNSVSACADGEHFLSADDLRINLWNVGRPDEPYALIDIKPDRIEDLTQVITRAAFHPHHPHIFAWGLSRGGVCMADLRTTASPALPQRIFDGRAACEGDPACTKLPLLSDVLPSVSDFAFGPFGTRADRFLATRDYLTVKVWDVAMERSPLAILPVHDYLRPRLFGLYESEAIFDKFELAWSHDGESVLTGTYHNFVRQLRIFDSRLESDDGSNDERSGVFDPLYNGSTVMGTGFGDQVIHADKSIFKVLRRQASASRSSTSLNSSSSSNSSMQPKENVTVGAGGANHLFSNGVCEIQGSADALPFSLRGINEVDCEKRIQHLAVHPREQTMAIAASTNLFIFTKDDDSLNHSQTNPKQ